eukprot:CAMPEP_0196133502 /NCGR_PEP_ID=MMETSP0910-20130528/2703_1 /TAXON_ID=49265 /ORGANISM="Thalassiosira rotula, Strain GSO102" /LENGTH=69 /DNA_ID=CAMNT_0041393237 /DNA_START=277 /DNA_END=482 /DNA_ORIENTATION=+
MKLTVYHPPISPSSIRHVALASKHFRVFGLNDPAWKNAREDWKKYNNKAASSGNNGAVTASASAATTTA